MTKLWNAIEIDNNTTLAKFDILITNYSKLELIIFAADLNFLVYMGIEIRLRRNYYGF